MREIIEKQQVKIDNLIAEKSYLEEQVTKADESLLKKIITIKSQEQVIDRLVETIQIISKK